MVLCARPAPPRPAGDQIVCLQDLHLSTRLLVGSQKAASPNDRSPPIGRWWHSVGRSDGRPWGSFGGRRRGVPPTGESHGRRQNFQGAGPRPLVGSRPARPRSAPATCTPPQWTASPSISRLFTKLRRGGRRRASTGVPYERRADPQPVSADAVRSCRRPPVARRRAVRRIWGSRRPRDTPRRARCSHDLFERYAPPPSSDFAWTQKAQESVEKRMTWLATSTSIRGRFQPPYPAHRRLSAIDREGIRGTNSPGAS